MKNTVCKFFCALLLYVVFKHLVGRQRFPNVSHYEVPVELLFWHKPSLSERDEQLHGKLW